MLSYQHAYHAGNHADILKHTVLVFVLNSLNAKEKPYTVFDTHAGSALYDLLDNRSQKTHEAEQGILALAPKAMDAPPALQAYLSAVSPYLLQDRYPGSPLLAAGLLRPGDSLVLSELHPQEIVALRKNMARIPQKNISIHRRDGWEMLCALTPPQTKRGVALLDPSYEETADYLSAERTVCAVHKKWSNGILLLWYPLLAHREHEISAMLGNITAFVRKQNPNTALCDVRLCVAQKDAHKEVPFEQNCAQNPPRLYGSGMLVINAPWHLEESVTEAMEFVRNALAARPQTEG